LARQPRRVGDRTFDLLNRGVGMMIRDGNPGFGKLRY
jgi:hypothetical protein